MSEIVKSEYNALGEDNNYKTHYFKTSADQVVGLGRMKNTEYQVGDVVYSDTNNKVALKCITDGTTSNTELDVSGKSVGDGVTDGSVMWEVVSRDAVSIIDQQRPIKTFISLEQLGLNPNTASEEDIALALPTNSVLRMTLYNHGENFTNPNLIEDNGVLVVKKGADNVYVEFELFNNGANAMYKKTAGYTEWKTPKFSGWEFEKYRVSSLPSGYYITVNIRNNNDTYIANSNGWLYVVIESASKNFSSGVTIENQTTKNKIWHYLKGTITEWDFIAPMAKGDKAMLHISGDNQVVNINFRPVQSEV